MVFPLLLCYGESYGGPALVPFAHRFLHRCLVDSEIDLGVILEGFEGSKSVVLGVDLCMIFACRFKSSPKNGQERPKSTQERPRAPQERPKSGPRAASEVPKSDPRAAKTGPRAAKSKFGSFLGAVLHYFGDQIWIQLRSCMFVISVDVH